MSDFAYIRKVNQMTWQELLTEILVNPEYLIDSYYKAFGDALRKRAIELIKESK